MDIIAPIFWPFYNIYAAVVIDGRDISSKDADAYACKFLDTWGHIGVIAGTVRAFLLAYAAIFYLSPHIHPNGIYPAFGGAETFSLHWMMPIITRNILSTWIICGFWDWFLHFSPLKEKLSSFKMNPLYPSIRQITHDAFWTTVATLFGSMIEIVYCYAYCNKIFPSTGGNVFNFTLSNSLWIMFVTHWRLPHFYVIHRLMHPWKTTFIFDFGQLLYRHIHSLHHKSYNPTAFSGTSMHPVESTLYYSACFIAVPFGCHPVIVLTCLVDCAVGAWTGHDGFTFPGSGDEFHQLHHTHSDCNYGTSIDGIDYFMGTAISTKHELKSLKKWS